MTTNNLAPPRPPFLAPPQAPDEIGRFGTFRVLEQLGQGGMGLVLRAEDTGLNRQIALKIMPPELISDADARARFVREAQATAALDHEHIVAIYQVGEINGVPFFAMPVLPGETLEARLLRSPSLSLTEIVRIAREIALALACAHGAGLIHRDIKPANVFLKAPAGQVKVLDFGLARGLDDAQKLTKAGLILGTPAYMAPEQADGVKLVDHRSDLFSLGVLLYRMLTGIQPFETPTLMGTISKLLVADPDPVSTVNPQVPALLAQLTHALLAKEPSQRPASAQQVADELAHCLVGGAPTEVMAAPTQAVPSATPQPPAAATAVPGFWEQPMTHFGVTLPKWGWLAALVVVGITFNVVGLALVFNPLLFLVLTGGLVAFAVWWKNRAV
jgi:serine/threonine protein kinase